MSMCAGGGGSPQAFGFGLTSTREPLRSKQWEAGVSLGLLPGQQPRRHETAGGVGARAHSVPGVAAPQRATRAPAIRHTDIYAPVTPVTPTSVSHTHSPGPAEGTRAGQGAGSALGELRVEGRRRQK